MTVFTRMRSVMSAPLLDADVLIASFDADHVYHGVVRDWFIAWRDGFTTRPLVGVLIRWIAHIGGSSGTAVVPRELEPVRCRLENSLSSINRA